LPGALETMAKRLQGVLDESSDVVDLADELDEDYESLDETADEWNGQGRLKHSAADAQRARCHQRTRLPSFGTSSAGDQHPRQRQGQGAAHRAGSSVFGAGAPGRGQESHHLHRVKAHAGIPPQLCWLTRSYGDGIVLFNGTNSDARAQAIYKDWLKRHEARTASPAPRPPTPEPHWSSTSRNAAR
jgi:hypothetical protein